MKMFKQLGDDFVVAVTNENEQAALAIGIEAITRFGGAVERIAVALEQLVDNTTSLVHTGDTDTAVVSVDDGPGIRG